MRPVSGEDVAWTGTGWRIWRVGGGPLGGGALLRNPWTNSGFTWWWYTPAEVQIAECFHRACRGLVSETCTCGVRSMATLSNLAAFLAKDDQLYQASRQVGRGWPRPDRRESAAPHPRTASK